MDFHNSSFLSLKRLVWYAGVQIYSVSENTPFFIFKIELKFAHKKQKSLEKSRLFLAIFFYSRYLAEREGFEPPWACTQTVFKTASL